MDENAKEKQAVKLLYDASVLGAAHKSKMSRTGVFRVVDQIARFMVAHPDVDVTWTTYGDFRHRRDVIAIASQDKGLCSPVAPPTGSHSTLNAIAEPFHRVAATHLYPLVRPVLPFLHRWQQESAFDASFATGFDILHSPYGKLPKINQSDEGPVRFLTVCDLIAIKFPNYFGVDAVELVNQTINSLNSEDWVLCISDATRRDLLEYRDDLNPNQVRVTPLAADKSFTRCTDEQKLSDTRSRYGIPQDAPYFLSLCTLEPRKNLNSILASFSRLLKDLDEETYLVLAGAKGWKVEQLEQLLDQHVRVLPIGYVDDTDLSPLYSDAIAFVYPSFYEGFGLPPLEAMQCGTPVIASNNSSLPEVVGDAGLLVDPNSIDEIADAMLKLYKDETLRGKLSQSGIDRAKQFSWQRCGELTLRAYQEACGHR